MSPRPRQSPLPATPLGRGLSPLYLCDETIFEREGKAVGHARRLAKRLGEPVTVYIDYQRGEGWQPLRIEGRKYA